jgi:hypothetical protein
MMKMNISWASICSKNTGNTLTQTFTLTENIMTKKWNSKGSLISKDWLESTLDPFSMLSTNLSSSRESMDWLESRTPGAKRSLKKTKKTWKLHVSWLTEEFSRYLWCILGFISMTSHTYSIQTKSKSYKKKDCWLYWWWNFNKMSIDGNSLRTKRLKWSTI